MTRSSMLRALAILLAVASCAPSRVQLTKTYTGAPLPRPDLVLVEDFAVTPDEVKLDRGLSARLRAALGGASSDAQRVEAGHRVAAAISRSLIAEIRKLGLPSTPVEGGAATQANTLIVAGQLLSIDEGNRTRRNLIGFGAGRSEVQADAQLYYAGGHGTELVETFAADSESGRKPGALGTMGAGAVADRAAQAAATSAGASIASEAFGAGVDADGARLAKEIVSRLTPFFVNQGWIAPQ